MRATSCITSKYNILYIFNAKHIFKVRDTDIYLTSMIGGTIFFQDSEICFRASKFSAQMGKWFGEVVSDPAGTGHRCMLS